MSNNMADAKGGPPRDAAPVMDGSRDRVGRTGPGLGASTQSKNSDTFLGVPRLQGPSGIKNAGKSRSREANQGPDDMRQDGGMGGKRSRQRGQPLLGAVDISGSASQGDASAI